MNNTSIKDRHCTHSWMLSTGHADHRNSSVINMQGKGAVNGTPVEMSSAHGEVQGQTAMVS
jgi:hypothetical protein